MLIPCPRKGNSPVHNADRVLPGQTSRLPRRPEYLRAKRRALQEGCREERWGVGEPREPYDLHGVVHASADVGAVGGIVFVEAVTTARVRGEFGGVVVLETSERVLEDVWDSVLVRHAYQPGDDGEVDYHGAIALGVVAAGERAGQSLRRKRTKRSQ